MQKERRSHLLAVALLQAIGFDLQPWPLHMTPVDSCLRKKGEGAILHVQEKTARWKPIQFGLSVDLYKRCYGRAREPYSADDFDVLYVSLPEDHAPRSTHFYLIPVRALVAKRYLTDPASKIRGRLALLVYPPGTRQGRRRDEWASEFLVDTRQVARARQQIQSCFAAAACDSR